MFTSNSNANSNLMKDNILSSDIGINISNIGATLTKTYTATQSCVAVVTVFYAQHGGAFSVTVNDTEISPKEDTEKTNATTRLATYVVTLKKDDVIKVTAKGSTGGTWDGSGISLFLLT